MADKILRHFLFLHFLYERQLIVDIRTRTAQLFFAVTALNCYSEKELSCSGPSRYPNSDFDSSRNALQTQKQVSMGI